MSGVEKKFDVFSTTNESYCISMWHKYIFLSIFLSSFDDCYNEMLQSAKKIFSYL